MAQRLCDLAKFVAGECVFDRGAGVCLYRVSPALFCRHCVANCTLPVVLFSFRV